MRTPRFLHRSVVIAATVALSGIVSAQQPRTTRRGTVAKQQTQRSQQQVVTAGAADIDAMAKQAYQLANSATTLEGFTKALRLCGTAMKSNPNKQQVAYINKLAAWTYNKRGETLVKLAEDIAGVDQKRAAEYEQAAIKDFGLSVRFDDSAWKPRFNRAVSVAVLGDFKTALTDLDYVIEKIPTHKNAHFNRAEILLQLGQYERAVEDYSSVLEQDINDAAAYAGRGIARSAIGDSENALLDLNEVVRLEPENAIAYVDRADLHSAMGSWELAAADYRVSIKLDNSMGRAYQNVAWLMSTCPEKRFRSPDLAVRAAKKAIELDGQTYLGLDTLAAALAANGDFEKAQTIQEQAIAKAPKTEEADLTARLSLYKENRPYVEAKESDSPVRLVSAEETITK